MNPIGILQGRLSPPVNGRLQAFPVASWRAEFARAHEAGLACIEWVYEQETESENPLRTDAGVAEIRRLASETGVAVWSVCADYYMTERLISRGGVPQAKPMAHLAWLIGRIGSLQARYLVLPFVDASSLVSPREREALATFLKTVAPAAEAAGVELHLETDLTPSEVVRLMEGLGEPSVRLTYDIGNSAALGRDPAEELPAIQPWLGSVHVKDRLFHGQSVPLGSGAADFRRCFGFLHEADFQGPLLLQAAREAGLSEVQLAIRNRQFVEAHFAAAANRIA